MSRTDPGASANFAGIKPHYKCMVYKKRIVKVYIKKEKKD